MRLCLRVGGESRNADRGVGLRADWAWSKILPIQGKRLFHTRPLAEKIGEGVGQAEIGSQLGAVIRATQNPEVGSRRSGRTGNNPAKRMSFGQRIARHPVLEFLKLAGEMVFNRLRHRIQRAGGERVGARGSTDAEINTPWRQRLQHPKLLGHFQG